MQGGTHGGSAYGVKYQKRFAIRVLSQDCSSGPCERNWSTWALFHTKKRNKLKTDQLERLVFCHCNLQLLEKAVLSPEPSQVNVDKIDIEKVRDILEIPSEERYIYSMLYEELTAPVHETRAQRSRARGTRVAQVEAEPKASSSSSQLEEQPSDDEMEHASSDDA
ncbi:hypothetical protein L7F22_047268 [Adiantum nelumboides]|nr:hypothetical protein [Adiantum nelumboides]